MFKDNLDHRGDWPSLPAQSHATPSPCWIWAHPNHPRGRWRRRRKEWGRKERIMRREVSMGAVGTGMGRNHPATLPQRSRRHYQAKNTLQKRLKEHTVVLFSVSDSKCECVRMRQHRELPTMKLWDTAFPDCGAKGRRESLNTLVPWSGITKELETMAVVCRPNWGRQA